MKLFVTVGTTRFDLLVAKVCSDDFLKAASEAGIEKIIIQYGNSPVDRDNSGKLMACSSKKNHLLIASFDEKRKEKEISLSKSSLLANNCQEKKRGKGIQTDQSKNSPMTTIPLLETFSFTDTIHKCINEADIIVSHCGSGTVLDILRGSIFNRNDASQTKRLILVPNTSLMNNHQVELAMELEQMGVAKVCLVKDLIGCINKKNNDALLTNNNVPSNLIDERSLPKPISLNLMIRSLL